MFGGPFHVPNPLLVLVRDSQQAGDFDEVVTL